MHLRNHGLMHRKSRVATRTTWELVWYIGSGICAPAQSWCRTGTYATWGTRSFTWHEAWVIGGSGSPNHGNANRPSTFLPFGMGPGRRPQLSRSDHD